MINSGALIDSTETYRYLLWRTWEYSPRVLGVVMLNPSTADAEQDDPTIRRVMGFAKAWGFGGIRVLNLFALRSTDPRALRSHEDPIGPDNDHFLEVQLGQCSQRLAAWGAGGDLNNRGRAVAVRHGPFVCLGTTAAGHPKHPLYVRGDTQPTPLAVMAAEGQRGA